MEKLDPFVTVYDDPSYVFKSCSHDWIVVLQKLPDTVTNESRPVVDPKCAKFRADKLQVVDIIHKFDQTTRDSICNSVYEHKQIVYKKGEIIEVKDFDKNVNIVCAAGIHYYKTMKVAFYLELERVIDGEFYDWHNDGQVFSKRIYKDGKPEGEWSCWYDNGQKQSNVTYKDGKVEGARVYWYYNGQMESKGIYKDGKQEGEWIDWYYNGQMESKGVCKNGKREGKYIYWYDDGQMCFKGIYKDGKQDGEYIFWYSNGQMQSKGKYKDGKREGEWIFWRDNGKMNSKGIYKDGFFIE